MTRRVFFLPLGIFMALLAVLALRLFLVERGAAPELVPSVLIGRPAPPLDLPLLAGGTLTNADLNGRVTLVNFFASWCEPCHGEHPLLMELKKSGLRMTGIVYKDKPAAARKWLKEWGDPYQALALDGDGRAGIDFGVSGVPESYLIDKDGIVRFKQTGPLTMDVLRQRLLPLVAELRK